MNLIPCTPQAYQLLHDGLLALADVEANGLRIDAEYCRRQSVRLQAEIEICEHGALNSEEGKEWKERFGEKFKLHSNNQLGEMLFEVWGYKPPKLTANENPSVDEESLQQVNAPIVKQLLRARNLRKIKSTYFDNILRETVDGYLHPFFNLHIPRTYRSSSSNPNFQNIPVRDPEAGALIRKAFIPRPGQQLLEIDFKGAEVCVATCYHKDPGMIRYINNTSLDMHRDMAAECFLLEPDQVTKDTRYVGKNRFVFPAFYGSYWKQIAPDLWRGMRELKLKTVDGAPMREHLRSKDVDDLDDFTFHIQAVEERFWDRRFPVYAQWKKKWYRQYLKQGWFRTLTGFVCSGVMGRNDAVNYPVQGSAFHCLLWALIELNKELKAQGMKSCIVGQIHDSIVLDTVPGEREDVLGLAKEIITEDIRKEWPWVVVPLTIEAELAPVNGSWHQKKEVEL